MKTTRIDVLPQAVDLIFWGQEGISKRGKERGYNYFMNSYIHKVVFEKLNEDEVAIQARCYKSMNKNEMPHSLSVCLSCTSRTVSDSRCSCVAGLSGTCSHIIGLVYTLAHYQNQGLKEVPDELSSTSLPQQWHKPRGRKIKPQPVTSLVMAKPKKDRKRRPVLTTRTKQRIVTPTPTEVLHLKALTNTPLSYLLQEAAPQVETSLGKVQTCSSLFYQMKHFKDCEHSTSPQPSSCGNTGFPLQTSLCLSTKYAECNLVTPITQEEAMRLEESTHTQAESSLWFEARQKRLTASQFGRVIKRKKDVNTKFLMSLCLPQEFHSDSVTYGKKHENDAKEAYVAQNQSLHIHSCGLTVNPQFSFLGATPDAKVCDEGRTGIVEIKCPYSARDMTVREAVSVIPQFYMVEAGGNLRLRKDHQYFYQVQGQLMVTGAPFCDFVVYTSKDLHVERILPEPEVWRVMLDKLACFYMEHVMPFLASTDKKEDL